VSKGFLHNCEFQNPWEKKTRYFNLPAVNVHLKKDDLSACAPSNPHPCERSAQRINKNRGTLYQFSTGIGNNAQFHCGF
jgi:hypothetical protein